MTDNGTKVTIKYPENVPDVIKQEKINRIYDILIKHKSEQFWKNACNYSRFVL